MARRSVAVLSSSGYKVGYTTFKAAVADVDGQPPRAAWVSDHCIRLLPSCDGVEWRKIRSGKYGPEVCQVMRRLSLDEKGVS